MARKDSDGEPRVAPTALDPQKALSLLRDQLHQIQSLEALPRKNDQLEPWVQKTRSVLRLVFGQPSVWLTNFKRVRFYPGISYAGQPEANFQEAYRAGLASSRSVIEAAMFEYDVSHSPPAGAGAGSIPGTSPDRGVSPQYFVAHEFSTSAIDDLRRAIDEVFSGAGLKPYFADKEVREGHIFLSKILPMIRSSRFGIYDISNPEKPNVFIELGAAIALGSPYYIIVRRGVTVPSDLTGLDRIEYGSLEDLKSQLREKVLGRLMDMGPAPH